MAVSVTPFFHGSTALEDQGLLIAEVSISHSETPHSVGLLWTVIGPTLIHLPDITHNRQTDIHDAGGIRTRNTSKRAASDGAATGVGKWHN